ncbi:hypothetical protein C8R46DRAFT_1061517, partial [Mycena filopes]
MRRAQDAAHTHIPLAFVFLSLVFQHRQTFLFTDRHAQIQTDTDTHFISIYPPTHRYPLIFYISIRTHVPRRTQQPHAETETRIFFGVDVVQLVGGRYLC